MTDDPQTSDTHSQARFDHLPGPDTLEGRIAKLEERVEPFISWYIDEIAKIEERLSELERNIDGACVSCIGHDVAALNDRMDALEEES